jgi:hypothetical protein
MSLCRAGSAISAEALAARKIAPAIIGNVDRTFRAMLFIAVRTSVILTTAMNMPRIGPERLVQDVFGERHPEVFRSGPTTAFQSVRRAKLELG